MVNVGSYSTDPMGMIWVSLMPGCPTGSPWNFPPGVPTERREFGVSTDGAGGGESATKAAGAGGVWRVGALIERVGMLLQN